MSQPMRGSVSDVGELVAGYPANTEGADGTVAPTMHVVQLLRRPLVAVGTGITILFIAMAVAPSLFTSTSPTECDLGSSLMSPSGDHWFGTDLQGCDVYSRTIYAARASLTVGFATTVAVFVIGGVVGLAAGFAGGWLDSLLSRVTDVAFAIPLIVGGIVMLSAVGSHSTWAVVAALVVFGWPGFMRTMRASVLEVMSQDFIVAARVVGANRRRIIVRHVIPNAIAPLVVLGTTSLGLFITAESVLSFLGLGLQAPTLSWGLLSAEAQERFLEAPWALMFPSGFLVLAVLGFVMFGDGLRDALDSRHE